MVGNYKPTVGIFNIDVDKNGDLNEVNYNGKIHLNINGSIQFLTHSKIRINGDQTCNALVNGKQCKMKFISRQNSHQFFSSLKPIK